MFVSLSISLIIILLFSSGAIYSLLNQIGYVPQDNVLMSMLTVEEAIAHSARTRLPLSWSRADRHRLVNEVIEVLGLMHGKRVRTKKTTKKITDFKNKSQK